MASAFDEYSARGRRARASISARLCALQLALQAAVGRRSMHRRARAAAARCAACSDMRGRARVFSCASRGPSDVQCCCRAPAARTWPRPPRARLRCSVFRLDAMTAIWRWWVTFFFWSGAEGFEGRSGEGIKVAGCSLVGFAMMGIYWKFIFHSDHTALDKLIG